MDRLHPARVPSDTVIPLHAMDDDEVFRASIIELSFFIIGQLDAKKLHDTLWRLMVRDEWKKLGARLRLNRQGRLEYHIPANYDNSRPPFVFSYEHFPLTFGEHPLANRLPRQTSHISVVGDPVDLRPFTQAPGAPTTLSDFLYSDRPQLTVHIVVFEDTTFLGANWPHTYMDGLGFRSLMDCWLMALDNKLEELPAFHGYDVDPFVRLGANPVEESVLRKWIVSDEARGRLEAKTILRTKSPSMADEARTICIPSRQITKMKEQALKDLSDQFEWSSNMFLSDGDIISSWWARTLLQVLDPPPDRLICLRNSFSMRSLLEDEFIPKGATYMANALMGTYTVLSAHEILTKQLGFIAAMIRRDVKAQSTRGQVEAFQATAREFKHKTGKRVLFGDDETIQLMFSNLSKCRFFDMDFSAAVVRDGVADVQDPEGLGRVVYQHYEGHFESVRNLFIFPIIGKDRKGNYWLSGKLPHGIWDLVTTSLALNFKPHI